MARKKPETAATAGASGNAAVAKKAVPAENTVKKQPVDVAAADDVVDADDVAQEDSPSRSGVKYEVPDGLTKCQKKNLKKKLREKEKKAEEAAGIRRGVPQMPEDPLQAERVKVVQDVSKTLANLPSLAQMKSADVVEKFRIQQDTLQDHLHTLSDALENLCTKIKKPDNRRMQSAQLLERIRELVALPERDEAAVDYLSDQLLLTVSWENARKFQSQLVEVRQEVEDRQRSNERFYENARAWERKAKLVDRIKALKMVQPGGREEVEKLVASRISSVEVEVSGDALVVLLPPLNVYRRMEKVFGVVVERSMDRSRQRTFVVSGLDKDIAEAVQFLQEADFSGGCKVTVDPRILPQLIGKGGSGIRQLEDTYKCFFQTRENSDVLIYGTRVNEAKAIQHITQMKVDRSSDLTSSVIPVEHAAIARALTTVHAKEIRDIEAKHSVNVRVYSGPPPSSAASGTETAFGADVSSDVLQPRKQPDARPAAGTRPATSVVGGPTVTIRGSAKAGVEAARAAVTKILAPLTVMEIPTGSAPAMKRLFSRVSFNGEVDLNRASYSPTGRSNEQLSVGDRFCGLVELNNEVAFMRHGDAVAVVGTAEGIKKVYDEAKALVESAGYTAMRLPVLALQLPVLSAARLAVVGEATGASLSTRYPRGANEARVEILGSEAEKAKAADMVKEILKTDGCTETVKLHDRTLTQLLRASGAAIRSLEEKHQTRISVDREDMSCTIVGNPSKIATTRAALQEMNSKNAHMESRTLPIPSTNVIPRLIGTKGATIGQIRATSKIDNIDIDDKELVVVLRGTSEACDEAEKQINEIFNAPQRAPRNAAPPPSSSAHKPHTALGTSAAPNDANFGESVEETTGSSPHSSSPNAKRVWGGPGAVHTMVAGEPAFPTLGEVVDFGRQPKRTNRRRRQGPANTANGYEAAETPEEEEEDVEE